MATTLNPRETSREQADMLADDFRTPPQFEVAYIAMPADTDRIPSPDELRRLYTRLVTEWPESRAVLGLVKGLARDAEAVRAPAERPWELATAFHRLDDAEVTVAAVWRTRRKFAAVGWETRLVSDVDSDALQLQVRPRPGCARPTYGTVRETPKWTNATVEAYRQALGAEDDETPVGVI
jgi:hypothetical protein